MRAILYDCSDHLNAQYRGVTLRLIDDDGRMVLQGQVLTNDGRDLAQRIAAGLGAELTYVGPPESPVSAPGDRSAVTPVIVAKTLDVQRSAECRDAGWLF